MRVSVQLLDESYFQDVEKIKTMGSSYMAASGLSPNRQVSPPLLQTSQPHKNQHLDKREKHFSPISCGFSLTFRSVRMAGITSASWFCSLCPCRKRSNTSTRTQETASSSESVGSVTAQTGGFQSQLLTSTGAGQSLRNKGEPLMHILHLACVLCSFSII